MNKRFLIPAAVFGALAVIAGAFLAHQLKQKMPAEAIEVYETAVRYQFYHVFALLACGMKNLLALRSDGQGFSLLLEYYCSVDPFIQYRGS